MSSTDWRRQFAVISWRHEEQKKYVSESKRRGHRATIKQMRWGLCLIYSEEKLNSRIKRPLKAIKLAALWRQAVSQEGALWDACLALFLVNLGITCRSIRERTWIVGCGVLFAVCVPGPCCDLCLHSVKFFFNWSPVWSSQELVYFIILIVSIQTRTIFSFPRATYSCLWLLTAIRMGIKASLVTV